MTKSVLQSKVHYTRAMTTTALNIIPQRSIISLLSLELYNIDTAAQSAVVVFFVNGLEY